MITPSCKPASLWLISRTPCPSHLRDNYSQQPWRRIGALKTVAFYIHAYIYLQKCSSLLIWLLPLLASLKVIYSCRVPVSFFFWTLPTLTTYLTFLVPKTGRLRFLLLFHGQLFRTWKPDELTFLPGISRPSREDALCFHEQYKFCVMALFSPRTLRNTGLSVFLFSLHSFLRETDQLQDRGLLPFDHFTCNTPFKLAPKLRWDPIQTAF